MVEQGPPFATEQAAPAEADAEGFDLEQARELAGFVVRAARRRPRLAVLTFATVAAVGLTVAATMPRTYNSQVKLLAQRSSAFRALSGNQGLDPDENPTKNVAAMIMRRDNLVALAKDAHLVERFESTRPPALRFKDRMMQAVYGPPSEEDKLLGMVFTLERQLEVSTDEAKEANLTISVDWSNPRTAFDLVTMVQKNFLEARYDSEVAIINDSLAILEDHAKTELDKVDTELTAYQKLLVERAALSAANAKATARSQGGGGIVPIAPRVAAPGSIAPVFIPDPEVAKALEEKRLQIRALEDARGRTIENLRQQLVEKQLTLTPMHPSIIALQQQLDVVSQTPPELAQLRSEERALMAQLVPPRPPPSGGSSGFSTATPPGLGARSPIGLAAALAVDAGAQEPTLPVFDPNRDGPLQLQESKLGSAIRAYQDVLSRIDSARVEMDITRAAYKYKYTVVTPAELPKGPKKGTPRVVAISSVIGAFLFALLLAAGLDLAKGSILESWQVRRRLKLEVLGELDRPA
jgi:uncharacterized protein involved in exopolysaccharide biosynthesis